MKAKIMLKQSNAQKALKLINNLIENDPENIKYINFKSEILIFKEE